MKTHFRAAAALAILFCLSNHQLSAATDAPPPTTANSSQKLEQFRKRANHIIVVYKENWSFDGLYGKFPSADGIAKAGAAARQVDKRSPIF